jgi:hypothetical protein
MAVRKVDEDEKGVVRMDVRRAGEVEVVVWR